MSKSHTKNVDTRDIEKYLKGIEKARDHIDEFYDYALRQIAADFLDKVINLTPVQENNKYIRGGWLRRAWVDKEEPNRKGPGEPLPPPTPEEQQELINSLDTEHNVITIVNNAEYSRYVNDGHKKPNGRGIIEPQNFVEDAMNDVEPQAILDGALARWLKKL